jgi:hypothetical protein
LIKDNSRSVIHHALVSDQHRKSQHRKSILKQSQTTCRIQS